MTIEQANEYFSSLPEGFAPAEDPKVAVCVLVEESGSGGQVAAPVIRQLFENILPYLEEKEYNEK